MVLEVTVLMLLGLIFIPRLTLLFLALTGGVGGRMTSEINGRVEVYVGADVEEDATEEEKKNALQESANSQTRLDIMSVRIENDYTSGDDE